MCVIIIKQKGMRIPEDVAKTSSQINPHGLGIVWLDTFEVTYHNSSEYKKLNTHRPFIAHFRYATIGAINRENTHPFVCGKNKNELLMMNGTIRELGNDKMCDSKVLAIQLGDKPRHTWKEELEAYDSRFVTINVHSKTFQIYNKYLWVQRDGVWYSKGNVLEEHYIAVYGTLKRNYSNYYNYLSQSKFVGSGLTKNKYPLIIKGLPYMVHEQGVGHNVDVDVFKVNDSTLDRLDTLEGHPQWYCRKQTDIVLKDRTIKCWVYFNNTNSYKGLELHSSYKQDSRGWEFWDKQDKIESKKEKSKWYEVEVDVEEVDEVDEFSISNESPVCVDCYHDVVFDGFSNYHCSGCNGWFTEAEVIRFRP